MKRLLKVCLVALILTGTTPSIAAQSAAGVVKQKGITVDLPPTSNAVAVTDADKEDAVVVTVARDGSVYLGVDLTSTATLAEKVRNVLSNQSQKTLYIKADARVPYASLVRILDSVRTTGVQEVTLLTSQRDSENHDTVVPPKGLEMLIVTPH
jgi:biopolymer transport protein ExbD/biopolymer transport protein TolR